MTDDRIPDELAAAALERAAQLHMPRFNQATVLTGAYTQLAYRLEQLAMWTLHVSFRPLGERTEVTIAGDLRPGAHANLKYARVGGFLGAGLGGASGVAMGLAIVSLASALVPVVLGVALAAGGTGMMAVAYRALYRRVLSRTEAEFENVLAAVSGDLSRKALLGE